jgi:hypothetical protein
VHSLERSLALLERELSVSIPRALFAPGGSGEGEPIDPELLLDPRGTELRAGELLPDALPFARLPSGDELALRFDGAGRPREVIRCGPGAAWHPSDDAPALPSEPDRHRRRAAEALDTGLARLAAATGLGALAADLGATREAFAEWLLDARHVPAPTRASLRRLTGGGDAALFGQDWEGAVIAAERAAAVRPELAWPGAVRGWWAEGRAVAPEAAEAYASALRAFATTLDFAGALFARPLQPAPESLAAAWARCQGEGPPGAELGAALAGPEAVRARWLAESDRARAAGRPEEAWEHALRAGWQRHRTVDMDDVLGRMLEAADLAGSRALAALARMHLRAWARRG